MRQRALLQPYNGKNAANGTAAQPASIVLAISIALATARSVAATNLPADILPPSEDHASMEDIKKNDQSKDRREQSNDNTDQPRQSPHIPKGLFTAEYVYIRKSSGITKNRLVQSPQQNKGQRGNQDAALYRHRINFKNKFILCSTTLS